VEAEHEIYVFSSADAHTEHKMTKCEMLPVRLSGLFWLSCWEM